MPEIADLNFNDHSFKTRKPEKRDFCLPRFFLHSVEDTEESKKAGVPKFRSIEMVEIRIPGDKLSRPVLKVTDEHRRRWPEAYEQFKKGETGEGIVGTPLKQWTRISRDKVTELAAINIFSVEQLAELNDEVCLRIGQGLMGLKQEAIAFLESNKPNVEQILLDQAEQIKALQEQLRALQSDPTKQPKRRGRPPKVD